MVLLKGSSMVKKGPTAVPHLDPDRCPCGSPDFSYGLHGVLPMQRNDQGPPRETKVNVSEEVTILGTT